MSSTRCFFPKLIHEFDHTLSGNILTAKDACEASFFFARVSLGQSGSDKWIYRRAAAFVSG
jgi:hypothetical protein